MSRIVVIADELNGVGFGLAGVDTRSPADADVATVFAQALASASLLLLTPRSADALGPGTLGRALARQTPLVAVVPDITAPLADSGFARRMRAVLGIAS